MSPLSDAAVKAAAKTLLDARRAGRQIDRLPDPQQPNDVADGYRIQHEGHRLAGRPVGPWKIGATNTAAQAALGIGAPFIGQLDVDRVVRSGACLDTTDWFLGLPLIETEIGLRLNVDLTEVPEDPMDLASMVEAIPCLELVNSRFVDALTVGAPSLVADNGLASAIVAGEPLGLDEAGVRSLDQLPVTISLDGDEKAEGLGSMALDHPLNALQFAARQAIEWATPMTAGQLVVTGTCTGAIPAASGMHAVGRCGEGVVEITFQ